MGFGSYMDGKGRYPWADRAYAAKTGKISWKDFRKFQGEQYRAVADSLAMDLVEDPDLRANLQKMESKVRLKVIQRAIKPLVAIVRNRWRQELKSAKVSGSSTAFRRRYSGIGMRTALAKSIKGKLPSGVAAKSLRGYVSMSGGTTRHGKRGEAVTNAAQGLWLEYGTDPHPLGDCRKHPGTKPVTNVRRAMKKLEPRALVFFRNAVADGVANASNLKALKAKDARALFARGNKR